jgi:AAA15 family ATPase/GTPase
MLPINIDVLNVTHRLPNRNEVLSVEFKENKYFHNVKKQENYIYARDYSLEIYKETILNVSAPCFYCGSDGTETMPAFLHDGSGHNLWMYNDIRCSISICRVCNANYKGGNVKYIKRFGEISPRNLKKLLSFQPEILIPTLEPVHLHFNYSDSGYLEPKTIRAERTIDLFALNRIDLVSRRRMFLERVSFVYSHSSKKQVISDGVGLSTSLSNLISLENPIDTLFAINKYKPDDFIGSLGNVMQAINNRNKLYPYKLDSNIFYRSSTYNLVKRDNTFSNIRFSGVKAISFYGIREFNGIQTVEFNGKSSIIIVGENGVGKSTLLELFKRCLKKRYKKNVRDLSAQNVDRDSLWYSVEFNNHEGVYKYEHNKPARNLSEGCHLVHINDSRSSSRGANLIIEFLNFNESNIDVVDWVLKQITILLDFSNEIEVKYKTKNIFVHQNGYVKYLNELSSGYNSILSIFGLILKQISKISERIELSEIYHSLSAMVVLIDEIELHLHPRFKKNIISTLKNTFPEVTFVFTTHDPMVLSSSKYGDVVLLLVKDRGNGLVSIRKNLPNHSELTTEQILSSPIFGLDSLSFEGNEDLILDYYSALSNEDKSLARELRKKLGKIGYFGKTYRDLIAYSAVDSYISKGMEPDFDKILTMLSKSDRND